MTQSSQWAQYEPVWMDSDAPGSCTASIGVVVASNATIAGPCGKPSSGFVVAYIKGFEFNAPLCSKHKVEFESDAPDASDDWPRWTA